jgi:stage V sporulation protein G
VIAFLAGYAQKARSIERVTHRVEAVVFEVDLGVRQSYASICFDDCFLVHDIRVIKGPTGLYISFPNRTHSEGGQRDIAFQVNAEMRDMMEQAVLAEYEKIVAENDP